jgi:hypothetical protein
VPEIGPPLQHRLLLADSERLCLQEHGPLWGSELIVSKLRMRGEVLSDGRMTSQTRIFFATRSSSGCTRTDVSLEKLRGEVGCPAGAPL